MSSNNELESGSSLAEDAWAVPSITDAAVASNDQTTSPSSSKCDNNNNKSSTVDEAWAKIAALRSKLAADVITDPASDDGNNPFNFPSFISPYEQPNISAQPNQSYKGMSIPLIYCDQTASQRPIASIENYLQSTSMPCHANTHTNITYTGSQSTAFVSEARQIVGECTGARITGKASLDSVIFGGNGVTGVVAILVDLLNLRGIVNNSSAAATIIIIHTHLQSSLISSYIRDVLSVLLVLNTIKIIIIIRHKREGFKFQNIDAASSLLFTF